MLFSSSIRLGTPHQRRHPRLPERQQGAATVRRHRRRPGGTTPSTFPWTIGLAARATALEARIYARYILEHLPECQDRAALSERRFRQGLPQRVARRARRHSGEDDRQPRKTYEPTDPTVDFRRSSRCTPSGADVLADGGQRPNSPRRRSARSTTSAGSPTHFLASVSDSGRKAVLQPAGPEKGCRHHLGGHSPRSPTDPQWAGHGRNTRTGSACMKKYNPSANLADVQGAVFAYTYRTRRIVAVLERPAATISPATTS